MPKITRHGGPSNAAEPDAAPATKKKAGEPPSPGKNSSPSPGKPGTSPKPKPATAPQPAPMTANPSAKDRTGSTTARGTGGGQTAEATK